MDARTYNFDKGADVNNLDTVTPSYDVGTPATNFCRSRKANKRKRTLGKARIELKELEIGQKNAILALFSPKNVKMLRFFCTSTSSHTSPTTTPVKIHQEKDGRPFRSLFRVKKGAFLDPVKGISSGSSQSYDLDIFFFQGIDMTPLSKNKDK